MRRQFALVQKVLPQKRRVSCSLRSMAVGQEFDGNPLLGAVAAGGGLCSLSTHLRPDGPLPSREGSRLTMFKLCGSMAPLAHSSADYFETNGLPATE